MQMVKIKFGSFWPGFDPENNFIVRTLKKVCQVELSDQPDLFFFTHSYNGEREYFKYNCHRVFLGWENARTDWTFCDYALDSDFISGNPRHKRWPIWAAWNLRKLTEPKDTRDFLQKKKFACMLVSNPHAKERIEFFHKLSKYKQVDSGGKYLNNVGGPVVDKLDFIKDYKFVLSFENSSNPGYTTEKLFEPMLVNSIPVYWGNPVVERDFNTKSFVHVNQYSNFDEAIQRIIELDQNEGEYLKVVRQPWFLNNEIPPEMRLESLEEFFTFVIKDMLLRKAVGASWSKSSLHKVKLFASNLISIAGYHLGTENKFR
jgi:alpha(1,3/1,4) fucosyltransferase